MEANRKPVIETLLQNPQAAFVDAHQCLTAVVTRSGSTDMKALELLPPSRNDVSRVGRSRSSFEGIFFAGVRTTGIFCRPTCTAKAGP
jgi:hypothetical protein